MCLLPFRLILRLLWKPNGILDPHTKKLACFFDYLTLSEFDSCFPSFYTSPTYSMNLDRINNSYPQQDEQQSLPSLQELYHTGHLPPPSGYQPQVAVLICNRTLEPVSTSLILAPLPMPMGPGSNTWLSLWTSTQGFIHAVDAHASTFGPTLNPDQPLFGIMDKFFPGRTYTTDEEERSLAHGIVCHVNYLRPALQGNDDVQRANFRLAIIVALVMEGVDPANGAVINLGHLHSKMSLARYMYDTRYGYLEPTQYQPSIQLGEEEYP